MTSSKDLAAVVAAGGTWVIADGMCRFCLAGVENSSMAAVWNAWVKRDEAEDADVAQNVVNVIAQVRYSSGAASGFLSR